MTLIYYNIITKEPLFIRHNWVRAMLTGQMCPVIYNEDKYVEEIGKCLLTPNFDRLFVRMIWSGVVDLN